MAQLISPITGAAHQAPVRSPFALPFDRHWSLGPVTRIWPVPVRPLAPPSNCTSASRAAMPLARGQGCPLRHEPPISRAAMPASRMRGPSRHQTGPSPSHTLTGVQTKACPLGTIAAASRNAASISVRTEMRQPSCVREQRQYIGPSERLVGQNIIAAQAHREVPSQLRYRAPPCARVSAANLRHQGRLGGCERYLEVEGQTIFIDSEHGGRIEQRKNSYQPADARLVLAKRNDSVAPCGSATPWPSKAEFRHNAGPRATAFDDVPVSACGGEGASLCPPDDGRRHLLTAVTWMAILPPETTGSWQAGSPRSLRRNPWSGGRPNAINP